MGEQDHGNHAERTAVSYWDAEGNETVRYYAADVPDDQIPRSSTRRRPGFRPDVTATTRR